VAGRKPKYQEFLQSLSDVTGLTGAAFAKACGKQATNMSSYLRGSKKVSQSTARSAVTHLRDSWPVEKVLEVELIPKPLTGLTTKPGVYALYGSAGDVLYVGQATNLRAEVSQTLNRKVNFTLRRGPQISKKAHPRYRDVAVRMSAYVVQPPKLRHNLEALLLRVYLNEAHNNKMGSFR
jgi:alpha-D-ribose 1-methylphosphonate 5-triphosphate synthase subunit PhnG